MSDLLWHTKTGEEVLSELDTPLGGLSSEEAEMRLGKYGENKLREPDKVPAFIRFLSQYHDPLQLPPYRSGFTGARNTSRQTRRRYIHWYSPHSKRIFRILAGK